jgi:hypothetical protein
VNMYRLTIVLAAICVLVSCSKSSAPPTTITPIPDIIIGQVREIDLRPVDINTPGQAFLVISMNDALYKVQFDATSQAESNATIFFATDTILVDESREFGNFGQDVVSYNPLYANELLIEFKEGGKRVSGEFNSNTSFGGTFGRDLISQWREASVPNKPNQKAKDDLQNLVRKYMDSNGDEPGIIPTYLAVTVSRM